jgi:predicted small lipoprotein YifL
MRLSLLSLCGLLAVLALAACGGDGGGNTPDPDASPDADAATDGSSVVPDADPDGTEPDAGDDADVEVDVTPEGPEDIICRECTTNEQCGEGNFCLNFPGADQFCGYDCAADPAVCPTGTYCEELAGGVRQCVPDSLICLNACEGVVCDEGLICDPTQDGACVEPLSLCEECALDLQCGEGNLCLQFADIDGRTGCATDCSAGQICPEGYVCANIRLPEGTAQQCIPEIQTCVDRCETVVCDEGEYCDPRRGRCAAQSALCEPCDADSECAGENARCLGLAGPPCRTDADCGRNEFCGTDGTCVAGRCGQDCSLDELACPAGYACFNLADGGAQCLPLNLSCEDRCADVVCAPNEACDPQTGLCVVPRLKACGEPCTANSACGGTDDLCLTLDGFSSSCLYACGDPEEPCPVGYQCLDLFTETEFCVPTNFDFTCGLCADITCPAGTECNPNTGACIGLPTPCSFEEPDCPPGTLCNDWDGRCEPIGMACTYETRTTACDLGTMRCTSGRPGLEGTCEQACFGAAGCPAERPACTAYHGVIGSFCAAPDTGGAHTCGVLAPTADPIGAPCDTAGDPLDPAVCPNALADYCLEGLDPALPGFCTRPCAQDSDCGSSAQCVPADGGNYCAPLTCDCAVPVELGEGVIDAVGLALSAAATGPCSVRWPVGSRRAVWTLDEADDVFSLHAFRAAFGEPTRALREVADWEALDGSGASAVPAIRAAAQAWGVAIGAPEVAEGSGDLASAVAAIDALAARAGGDLLSTAQIAELEAQPAAVLAALATLVPVLDGALEAHRSLFVIDPGDVNIGVVELAETLYAGFSSLSLTDADWIRGLTATTTRRTLAERGAALAAAIEAVTPALAATEGSGLVIDLPTGDIIIGGSGDDTWSGDEPLLLIELGGDDTYTIGAGVASGGRRPVSVVVDLGGADLYTYTKTPIVADDGLLPSDADGRAEPARGGDGRVSLSSSARQGAGRFGWGLLYDLGAGADTYESLRYSQGFGLMGVGVLVDSAGDATLTMEALGQGAGLFGIGVLVLGDAGSEVTGTHGVQGFGGPAGVGVAVGGLGDDDWRAEPGEIGADTVIYRERLSGLPWNLSAAQGAGLGWAPGAIEDGSAHGGGVGVLWERGGNDTFVAGVGAQGFGHWHGTGLLVERSGDDELDARGLAMGSGWIVGGGLLLDEAGNDTRGVLTDAPLNSMGAGEDFAWGILVDLGGDDENAAGAFSLGAGTLNGFGLFADAAGADTYRSESNDTLGTAVLTLIGREPSDNPRRGIGTWGIFADAEGMDTYDRPDLLSPRVADDARWVQVPDAESTLPVFGAGADDEGGLGLRFAP